MPELGVPYFTTPNFKLGDYMLCVMTQTRGSYRYYESGQLKAVGTHSKPKT